MHPVSEHSIALPAILPTDKIVSNELKVFLNNIALSLEASHPNLLTNVQSLQAEFLPLDEQSLRQRINTVRSRIVDIFRQVDQSTLEKLQQIPRCHGDRRI